MTHTWKPWLALALLGLLSSPAFAEQTPRKNLQIFNDAAREVTRYPRFTIFDDVSIAVDDGAVRLSGKVTMPYKRREIESRVRQIDGVRRVRNDIEVLPVSRGDDQLRRRVARAIYNHSSFRKYAAAANPPIHIIVERSRITLTGVVQNAVERMLARAIATTVQGSLSVENRLRTDAEVRAAAER
jgi:osmotically-inducible protein OsmY